MLLLSGPALSSAERNVIRQRAVDLPLVIAELMGTLAIGLSAVLAIWYSGQHILEAHSFRQTQTALTSFWLCHTGLKPAYETPVGGYPWSLPFEFPLYQFLVAKVSCALGFDLERVGRLVSYLFLLGCLIPASKIFRFLFPNSWKLCFWVFTSLFLTSPMYLFWGRAFLMETTALFLALCFLNSALHLLTLEPRWRDVTLSFVFLTLAMLQKATTVAPLLPVIAAMLATCMVRERHQLRFQPLRISKLLIAFVVPLVLGYVWLNYSDWVRSQNPLGAFLTSKALFRWSYGTVAARFSREFWVDVILKRTVVKGACGLSCVAIALGAYLLRGKEKAFILLSGITFLMYFLIFENLHFVHDYYQVANGVFLILGAAVAIAGFLQIPGKQAIAALLFFVAAAGTNLMLFGRGYYHAEAARFDETTNDVLAVSSVIRHSTDQQRPILVYGDDWSSEIAFFSQRKSFTVPHFFSPYTRPIRYPASYLGQQESAVVLCGEERHLRSEVLQWFKAGKIIATQNCTVFVE